MTMGNVCAQLMTYCCDKCYDRLDKRKYLRTRYNVERDFSIEFENLMEDDSTQEDNTPNYGSMVTPVERSYIQQKRYEELVKEQRQIDEQVQQELVHQEEELRQEEEAYYEAKREAARVAKMQRMKEKAAKEAGLVKKGPKAWLGDDESDWEVAGGEDDFEMFLESVKARSLAARTRALPAQDGASEASSKEDRSRTEASSLDLEWEHEAGMMPVPKEKKKRFPVDENHLNELTVKPMLTLKEKQDSFSNDFEWDSDVGQSNQDAAESQNLLSQQSSIAECDVER